MRFLAFFLVTSMVGLAAVFITFVLWRLEPRTSLVWLISPQGSGPRLHWWLGLAWLRAGPTSWSIGSQYGDRAIKVGSLHIL